MLWARQNIRPFFIWKILNSIITDHGLENITASYRTSEQMVSRRNVVNRQTVRGILYFLIFFYIGFSLVLILNCKTSPKEPVAIQKKIERRCNSVPQLDDQGGRH